MLLYIKKSIITDSEFKTQKDILLNHSKSKGSYTPQQKGIFEWYVLCWKRYFKFSGRASRGEYWSFYLVNFLITFILGFMSAFTPLFKSIGILYTIAFLIPSLAVLVRRFHDLGKNAWFALAPYWILFILLILMFALPIFLIIFLIIVPVISIVWLIFTCLKGQPLENKYGIAP